MPQSRIVLASSSPRRRELLARAGVRFAVMEPPVEEIAAPPGICSDLAVQMVARHKALAVAEKQPAGTFVIAADTVVLSPRGGVLGKPGSAERARTMLAELSGRRHTVLTGVCAAAATGREALGVSRSAVRMRSIPDPELDAYVASGEPLDKAGAYAIQGGAADWVDAVGGRVDTVVGLDVALALRLLVEAGYPMPLPTAADVALPQRTQRRALSPLRARV